MANNIKFIREIYGATQSEIATALGVSRVTIAKWENETQSRISQANLEKLSLFFGIGPEYFYDMEVNEKIIERIKHSKSKAQKIDDENSTKKEEKFKELFLNTTFKEAISRYMFSMKLLLALSDEGEINDLNIVCKINEKMNSRLKAIIKIREEEQKKNDKNSFNELFDEFSFNLDKE